MAPSGRVLRRTVTDLASGLITEDVVFGYGGPGDSPAWSRPAGGGAVTSYVGGPGGLLVIDAAGVGSWPLANAHGDIVGVTDASGTFTPSPAVDEWGVGEVSAGRLGWLGAHERFTAHPGTGLMRMGVRLYDPHLGRFHQPDPIEGGCANDYTYVHGDPLNAFDLGGTADCRSLFAKIMERAFRDKRTHGGSGAHGLHHRYYDFFRYGKSAGFNYSTHVGEFFKTRRNLMEAFWNYWSGGCGPPPGVVRQLDGTTRAPVAWDHFVGVSSSAAG
ncbi:MAG: hypothetical protein M5U19_14990 [Microthrixaceae bacterium]|nr:hypothetical protein [Microthrixaceae bacterium]